MSQENDFNQALQDWQVKLAKLTAKRPERKAEFTTISGLPVERLYVPLKSDEDYLDKLGFPGDYPFTRGVQPTMYRGPLLDHAPVRRLCHGRGIQPALPLSAGPGPDRPFGGL